MQITQPVFVRTSTGAVTIFYDYMTHHKALDLGNHSWLPTSMTLLPVIARYHDVLLTNNDVIAHVDFIEKLLPTHTIVLYFDKKDKHAPNKLRMKAAYEKLMILGFKVKYFASRQTAENYITKLKEATKWSSLTK